MSSHNMKTLLTLLLASFFGCWACGCANFPQVGLKMQGTSGPGFTLSLDLVPQALETRTNAASANGH